MTDDKIIKSKWTTHKVYIDCLIHGKTVITNNLKCSKCSKPIKLYHCPFCDWEAGTKIAVEKHMKGKHE